MYAPDILHEHYEGLEKEFHDLFLKFQIELAGETIHQLRVNIKKQIAFFRMLRALENHFPLEEIQMPFAVFFKNIGKIRNLEIRQHILAEEEKKYEVEITYANQLEENIAKEKAHWETEEDPISLAPFREVSNKVKSSINRMPLDNVKETLGEYFYFLLEEIRPIVKQEEPRSEQLHDLRKLLKVLFYNLKLADRFISQETISEILYQKLAAYNDRLGDWHDQFITIYKLSSKKSKVDNKILKLLRKKERMARKEMIDRFSTIYHFTGELKVALFHLFAQDEPVNIPPQRFKEGKYREIRESLTQMNMGELMR